jgi:glycosyltransferase involved in cell wall biosynthesis
MVDVLIGIPVREEPARLAATLAAVQAQTPERHRILLLGDGPDPDVRAELARLSHLPQSNTEEPRGAAACFNRLCRHDSAEVVILLEAGAQPGPQWLGRILHAMARVPRCGLAGPSTNRSWNEQCLMPGGGEAPSDAAEMARLAARRFGSVCRTLEPLYSLSDFCYAVKRTVIETVGDADESYGAGPCWEMDYNIRAQRAGFKGLWVCGAWVHRMPVTARREAEEGKLFEASKHRYQDKFCGLRLRGVKSDYRDHCRGDACGNFAPAPLVNINPQARTPRARPAIGGVSSRIVRALTDGLPLASCIMPTADRRPFIPTAIATFLAQDYPRKELVVIDDGADPVADLMPADDRVRYIRTEGRQNVGVKRNIACREALGDYILHWDDDDWYPPDRISRQIRALLDSGAEICGSSALYYHNPASGQAFQYRYQGSVAAWMGALAYPRQVWAAHPFDDMRVAEDVKFLSRIPAGARVDLKDPAISVATIHASNTSPKFTGTSFWAPEDVNTVLDVIARGTHTPPQCPMVSCIMPTRSRRAFIPLALRCFGAQLWPRKELIVIDDGDQPVGDLLEGVPDVRYIRLPRPASIGAKRNIACEEARGEFIVHWDDDDWYAPSRLHRQVQPLADETHDLTGLTMSFVLEMPAGRFWHASAELHRRMFVGDIAGGTIAYLRQIWLDGAKYPEVNLAEDAAMIKRASGMGKRILRIDNRGEYVYLRHGRNTWQFEAGRFIDPSGWRQGLPPEDFTPDLLDSYRCAAQSLTTRG